MIYLLTLECALECKLLLSILLEDKERTMTNHKNAQIMLITGSNSGIGNATAKKAVNAGFITFGGARRKEAFDTIKSVGAIPILLDVTSKQSMQDAIQLIEAKYGAIDVLINNAGYGQMGPIEEVTLDEWRRQFNTNVFGVIRMTQLVIPAMRQQHRGTIINISSAGGEFTFPLAGAYHATKYAIESISDALRFELKPFGIRVAVIQPGAVSTPLATATAESIQATVDSPYQSLINAFRRTSQQTVGYIAPEQVARIIIKAAQASQPRTRYKVGMMARMMPTMRQVLSDGLWDRMVRRFYS
jgi:NADP-dependent 3-hydroxy acid dehydrogenase YdfG